MGKRLTRIYTRTGDDGSTGLANGSRAPKDAPRIEAIGAVDELNSVLGLVLCEDMPAELRDAVTRVQHELFDLGGELAVPGYALISKAHVKRLEQALDAMNASLAPLEDFILPGGSRAAALTHCARAVCRRAERRLVTLSSTETVPPLLVAYLNRLSDVLFVAARILNRHAGHADVLWQPGTRAR